MQRCVPTKMTSETIKSGLDFPQATLKHIYMQIVSLQSGKNRHQAPDIKLPEHCTGWYHKHCTSLVIISSEDDHGKPILFRYE